MLIAMAKFFLDVISINSGLFQAFPRENIEYDIGKGHPDVGSHLLLILWSLVEDLLLE